MTQNIQSTDISNFFNSFISLAYLSLAAYCTAILSIRLKARKRFREVGSKFSFTSRIPSGTLLQTPKSPLLTGGSFASAASRLSYGTHHAPDPTTKNEVDNADGAMVWDTGCWFYFITIIESVSHGVLFLLLKNFSETDPDAQFRWFGLFDPMFSLLMYLLVRVWYSSLWLNITAATGLEADVILELTYVPRVVTGTAVVVFGYALLRAAMTVLSLTFTAKLPQGTKEATFVCGIVTYLSLSVVFYIVGSQIRQSVSHMASPDERLVEQSMNVFRVSLIASSGLFIRALAVSLQLIGDLQFITNQTFFTEAYYFFLDFALACLVVASIHRRRTSEDR